MRHIESLDTGNISSPVPGTFEVSAYEKSPSFLMRPWHGLAYRYGRGVTGSIPVVLQYFYQDKILIPPVRGDALSRL